MIINANSAETIVRSEAGTKGYNLYLLSKKNIPVPSWVIIGKSTFNQFCEYSEINHLIDNILEQIDSTSSLSNIQEAASKIRNFILSTPLPDDLDTEIKEAHQYLNSSSIAVRSSIINNSNYVYSFAGLHANFLCITNIEQMLSCVKECWISAFSAQSLSYRILNNLDKRSSCIEIAVILQNMIKSEKSGKLFSTKITENKDQTVIRAMYGIFQDSQTFQADKYIIKNAKIASIDIVHKSTMNIPDQTCSSVHSVSVPQKLQTIPCLTNEEIVSLAKIGNKIESLLKAPQEIEWTWTSSSGFTILQTRQVINRSDIKPNEKDKTATDCKPNTTGITLPLTFSLKKMLYCNSFFLLCKLFRIPPKKLQELIPCFDQIYGLMFGRTYFNVKKLHYLSSFILPNLMAKKCNSAIDSTIVHFSQSSPKFTLKNFLTAVNLIWFHFRIDHQKKVFCDSYERILSKYGKYSLKQLSKSEICYIYIKFENDIKKKWTFPSVNDFLSLFYFKYLRFLTKHWLSHLGISLEQLIQLTYGKTITVKSIKKNPFNSTFSKDTYNNQLDSLLNNNLSVFQKIIFKWFFEHTRKTVQNREVVRFYRSQIISYANSLFEAMGKIYSNQRIIKEPEDIYYLHLNELKKTFNEPFFAKTIHSLICYRKDQFRVFKEITPPDKIITNGPVYFLNNPDSYQIHSPQNKLDPKIKGTGLFNSIAEGKVVIANDYSDLTNSGGSILVCKDIKLDFRLF